MLTPRCVMGLLFSLGLARVLCPAALSSMSHLMLRMTIAAWMSLLVFILALSMSALSVTAVPAVGSLLRGLH